MSESDKDIENVPAWMLEGLFGRSLKARLSDEDYDFGQAASIDVASYISECPMGPYEVASAEVTTAFRQTMQLMAARHIQETYWSLLDLTQVCQTQAQALLLLAFASLGFYALEVRRVNGVAVTVTHRSAGLDIARVTVKRDFVGYQTVFVVDIAREVPDFDHPVKVNSAEMPDVKEIPGVKNEAVHMLVEIERKPVDVDPATEQDAPLAALGFSVIRFKEANVLADPLGCARELADALGEPPPS